MALQFDEYAAYPVFLSSLMLLEAPEDRCQAVGQGFLRLLFMATFSLCLNAGPSGVGKDRMGGGEERKGEKKGERGRKDEKQEEGEKRRKERRERRKEKREESPGHSQQNRLL